MYYLRESKLYTMYRYVFVMKICFAPWFVFAPQHTRRFQRVLISCAFDTKLAKYSNIIPNYHLSCHFIGNVNARWQIHRNRIEYSEEQQRIRSGPVVQSFVSLTSSLVVKMLTVLISRISNSQAFLLKKNVSSFCKCKSYSHFFSKH